MPQWQHRVAYRHPLRPVRSNGLLTGSVAIVGIDAVPVVGIPGGSACHVPSTWRRGDPTLRPMKQEYDYTVIFVPDPDGGYVAEVPALGITTQGETIEEARAMAPDAIRGYLESLEKAGEPVPMEPRSPTLRVITESVRVGV